MRKIERQMVHAINCPGKRWNNSNTKVRWSDDQTYVEVLLHDHIIASINWAKNRAVISACGWETVTTKSRLNAILSDLVPGARINAKNFEWFFTYNDKTEKLQVKFRVAAARGKAYGFTFALTPVDTEGKSMAQPADWK